MSSGWFRVSHRTRPQTLDRIAPLFPASRESVDSQRPLPIPPATVSRSPPIDRCAEPPSHGGQREGFLLGTPRDRKSTRLNSSHVAISYAVFCLKKKNNKLINIDIT